MWHTPHCSLPMYLLDGGADCAKALGLRAAAKEANTNNLPARNASARNPVLSRNLLMSDNQHRGNGPIGCQGDVKKLYKGPGKARTNWPRHTAEAGVTE